MNDDASAKFGLQIPPLPFVGIGRAIAEPEPPPAAVPQPVTYDADSVTLTFKGIKITGVATSDLAHGPSQPQVLLLDKATYDWIADGCRARGAQPQRRRIRQLARARKLRRGWA